MEWKISPVFLRLFFFSHNFIQKSEFVFFFFPLIFYYYETPVFFVNCLDTQKKKYTKSFALTWGCVTYWKFKN